MLTPIVHWPIDSPLYFGVNLPEGNETAVHAEDVLAFSAEHYDYWGGSFGIPRPERAWCHWRENLKIAEIDDSKLRIGDLLCVGVNTVLQVRSPRIPCL